MDYREHRARLARLLEQQAGASHALLNALERPEGNRRRAAARSAALALLAAQVALQEDGLAPLVEQAESVKPLAALR